MASSLIQPVASLTNPISEKGDMRSRKGEEVGFLALLALPLMMKVLRKEVMRIGRAYNDIHYMDPSFKQHRDYEGFQLRT